MINNEILHKNLVLLLSMFSKRPNHLSQFLINHFAFTEDFKNSIICSDELNDLRPEEQDYLVNNSSKYELSFYSIYEMDKYFEKLLAKSKRPNLIKSKKSNELKFIDKQNKLNIELSKLLSLELYEDASVLRDYMLKNNLIIYN